MQTLLFYDPGHFHAALLLWRVNPRINSEIHVYGPAGPDLEKFRQLIAGFNGRADNPTHWRITCHGGDDALARLIAERRGEIVVLAGKNAPRLALMARLHQAGFHLLADKPWITRAEDLGFLQTVLAGPTVAMDIMTGHHDAWARLRQRVVACPEVFGKLGAGPADMPAIEISSRHHLLKQAGGRLLQRPAWYYDVAIQGDGLVDIQSHMCDQAQRLVEQAIPSLGAPDRLFDYERDVTLVAARRWPTPVDLALFRESTGLEAFPAALSPALEDGVLQLACNGVIDYRLCGVAVRQQAEWGPREAPGGGDIHATLLRGSKATLDFRQGPETGFQAELQLCADRPAEIETALAAALKDWRRDFPGLELAPTDRGWRLLLPENLQLSHEEQFPRVLDEFLDLLPAGELPRDLAARIASRYTLLAQAHALAD